MDDDHEVGQPAVQHRQLTLPTKRALEATTSIGTTRSAGGLLSRPSRWESGRGSLAAASIPGEIFRAGRAEPSDPHLVPRRTTFALPANRHS